MTLVMIHIKTCIVKMTFYHNSLKLLKRLRFLNMRYYVLETTVDMKISAFPNMTVLCNANIAGTIC